MRQIAAIRAKYCARVGAAAGSPLPKASTIAIAAAPATSAPLTNKTTYQRRLADLRADSFSSGSLVGGDVLTKLEPGSVPPAEVAEELERALPARAGEERDRGERGVGLGDAEAACSEHEPRVPPRRGPREPLGILVGEEQEEGERVGERELAEIAGGGHGKQEIAALDGALKLGVLRPFRRHEHMFAFGPDER
jgi:hypothetical protein